MNFETRVSRSRTPSMILFHAVAESQEPVPTLSDAVSPQKSALYPIDKPRTVPKNISPE